MTAPGAADGAGAQIERRFEFAFEPRYRLVLAGLGVHPSNSCVTLTSEELVARFGPWVCRSDVANIRCLHVTGPYKAHRAIGARRSQTDGGLTFGSTTAGGVCVCFREAVPGLDPMGRLRHPGLTVTVADQKGFADAIRAVATLEETD